MFSFIKKLFCNCEHSKINHKPISEPDKNHLHHQFLKQNFSQRRTVLIIYFIDILFRIVKICISERYLSVVFLLAVFFSRIVKSIK